MTANINVHIDYKPLDHSSVELGIACFMSALKETNTELKILF